MSKAKITLIGFYNYMQSVNDDLFSKLSTPAGIDKNILVNNILLKGGEFEVLYAEPYFYQNMIGVWSDKWQRTMQKWINALSIDYNPLENYDRMEDWEDSGSRIANEKKKETSANNANSVNVSSASNSSESSEEHENTSANLHSDSSTNNETTNKTETALASDVSDSTGNGTTTNSRSAYDASTFSNHDQSVSDTSGNNISSAMTNASGDTSTDGAAETSGFSNDFANGNSKSNTSGNQASISENSLSGDESRNTDSNAIDNTASKHSGRMHGNIGVTTSQQMLEAELEISRFNIYDELADMFLSEMCIYLY